MLSGGPPQRDADEAYLNWYYDFVNEYWVYILRCSDDKYYTGITNNMEERLQQHQGGGDPACFTYKRRPVELVYKHSFREVTDAIKAEKQIQGWSRRKKEALVRGDIALLQGLSMSTEKRRKLEQKNASSLLAQADA